MNERMNEPVIVCYYAITYEHIVM